jgi:hypothetical protein
VQNILLVTSTIQPATGTFMLKVVDAQTRLAQYRDAFDVYLGMLAGGVFDRIVYMDNSGYPLDTLRRQAAARGQADRVEFLSYTQTLPAENSRYYLEMDLIDHAMRMSAVLHADPEAVIWKVTGRYIVSNAAKIVKSWPDGADLYINLRNHPYKTLDFYFFGFRCGSYGDHIGRDRADFAGTRNGEDILREKIDDQTFGQTRVVKRLRHTPRLLGIRGFDGARYGGWKDRMKYELRRLSNTVVPGFWI